jgi:universal stress protein A
MPFPPKNILVPTDFSDGAEPAVAYAFALAKSTGAKVHVLHAYSIPAFPENVSLSSDLLTGMKEIAEKKLRDIAAKYQATGTVGEPLLRMGDPRDLISHGIAELNIDLVVMGTHGRRGLTRVILGSVAGYVIRTASCPVLVVPLAEKR